MADRTAIRRVRQALIRTGVADETMTDDEIEERASTLLAGMETFARIMRPALAAPNARTSQVFYVLGDLAKAVENGD